jgi:phosphomannomutase
MTAIFSATDIRGTLGDDLTIEYIWDIGKAFADWLASDGQVIVLRGSSVDESTVHALTEGVLLQGRSVIDAGTGDPQQLIATIMDKQAAGGVLIEYQTTQNLVVITLFDDRAVSLLDSTGLQQITQLVEAGNFLPAIQKGFVTTL